MVPAVPIRFHMGKQGFLRNKILYQLYDFNIITNFSIVYCIPYKKIKYFYSINLLAFVGLYYIVSHRLSQKKYFQSPQIPQQKQHP